MDQALDAVRQRAAELREIEAELGRLSDLPEAAPDPERIEAARRELLHWLSAPDAPGSPAARTAALLVIGAAGVAAAVAASLFFPPAAYALLAPAVIALVYVCLLLRRAGVGAGQRREAEQRYHRLGFERPEGWERERVAERLRELDRELGTARQRVDDLRRRREAERKRENLRAALEHESGRLADFARPVNFDPEKLDASFDRWLRLTGDYDRADVAVRKGRARLAALEDGSGAERAGITSFLAAHGEDPRAGVPEVETPGAEPSAAETPREETAGIEASAAETPRPAPASGIDPPTAKVLGQRLERLAGRVRQRDGAERDLRDAREDLERLSGEIGKRRAETEEVFRGAGLEPGEEAELRRRLELLEEWRALDRQLNDVRIAEDLLRGQLSERPDLLCVVEEDGEATLQGRRGSLRERAARGPGPLGRDRRDPGPCRARVEGTRARGGPRPAPAYRGRAPPALRRGAARGGRRLSARPGGVRARPDQPARHPSPGRGLVRALYPAPVRARDGGGRRRNVPGPRDHDRRVARAVGAFERSFRAGPGCSSCSSVRVSFAIEAEKGRTPLPLFLDEALTTADPDRFRAVADSLRRLSEEDGRQIFYLTAQPEEGRYWAEAAPAVIDLAASRRASRAVTIPEEVGLPPAAPEPPPPGGLRPEEYAVRIGVDPVQPWGPPDGLHVFHLLRDDLELLRRLLRAGVEHLGPLASLLDSDEAGLFLSPDEQSALRLRAAGARAWIEAWREGRGRPVDRDVLAASGAVTSHFIDRLAELAGEVDGDARRLLHAMDTGAVLHFRGRNRQRLEEWLRENAYLGDADPLDARGRERRVAMALTAHGSPPGASLAEAAELARSMAAGLAAGHKGGRPVTDPAAPSGTEGS